MICKDLRGWCLVLWSHDGENIHLHIVLCS
ncbi:hypothetical protein F383_10154 [Gossypium arboreum]|uniref:Uncharacterized protein n=1 Tax=Gossypium arboreum TaxID=29729 RepID=A0A0B0P6M5_GOSAR|nr:hypothetical protein F383_10154 [Gossypium arboreum]